MKQIPLLTAISSFLFLSVAACSPDSDNPSKKDMASTNVPRTGEAAVHAESSNAPAKTKSSNIIKLNGLGDLLLGQSVPKNSSWTERFAQSNNDCRTVSSPDYPGVYGMVFEGIVKRITVGQRSDIKLIEGIGVGSSEEDVKKWFGGFQSEPHKYESAPAKYLTAPNAATGDPAVRFEIGQDGKVSMLHVGIMPQLAYVEGCA